MSKILYGKPVSESILESVKKKVKDINKDLKLAVIRVKGNESSSIYVRNKKKACEKANILFEEFLFNEDVTEKQLLNCIESLNSDIDITGILVQLPLPKHIDAKTIVNKINYKKDVDGLNSINTGKLVNNNKGIIPCTAKGIMSMLKYYDISISGKNVLVIGRSPLVGIPVSQLLLKENATVTVAHSKTENLNELCLRNSIIIVAVGKANLITKDMVTSNTIIIDVGINRKNNAVTGDCNFEELKDKVLAISPVPGGVGLLTISSLLENILECYELFEKN